MLQISALGENTPLRIPVPSPASAPGPPVPAPRVRVLLIDDDPSVLEVVRDLLALGPCRVDTAGDGHEALALFGQNPYDLVITDRSMPKMSGDEVAVAVKALRPAVKVIMLTGFGDGMILNEEHPQGVDLILGKPLMMDDLHQAVAQIMLAP